MANNSLSHCCKAMVVLKLNKLFLPIRTYPVRIVGLGHNSEKEKSLWSDQSAMSVQPDNVTSVLIQKISI